MQLPAKPTVEFSWTPTAFALQYSADGNSYPYTQQEDAIARSNDTRYSAFATPINTMITFIADATVADPVFIVEYRWDFGDGGSGYGPVIGHTFKAANPATQVSLVVKDNYNRYISALAVMSLRVASIIDVSQGIVV